MLMIPIRRHDISGFTRSHYYTRYCQDLLHPFTNLHALAFYFNTEYLPASFLAGHFGSHQSAEQVLFQLARVGNPQHLSKIKLN